MRGLMGADLAAARERGEVVGLLWASHASIYGRFGFGPATRAATWTVDVGPGCGARGCAPGCAQRDAVSRPRRVTWSGASSSDGGRASPARSGAASSPWDVDARPAERGCGATTRGPARSSSTATRRVSPDGYVRYHLEERWERRQGRGVLHVDELHALTDEAYRDLWRLVCGMEWASTVRAEQRAPHERLPWLVADGRTAQPESVADGLWLALIDLPRALEARTYESEGRLVVGVASADGRVDASGTGCVGGGATCRPTDASPDVVVPASGARRRVPRRRGPACRDRRGWRRRASSGCPGAP